MTFTESVQSVDALINDGKFADVGEHFYAKSPTAYVSDILTVSGKSARKNLEVLQERLGSKGSADVLATRQLDDELKSVSLISLQGDPNADQRMKLMLLVARQWNDKGQIVEEEYLPVRSVADAQPYFPGQRLGNKQIQPRLRFITPTRKSRGKGGGRPRKPVQPTDLHRIPTIGRTVLEALNKAGIETFDSLSQAADDVLEQVRAQSGRRFVNFDPKYWRDAAVHGIQKGFENFPTPPKAKKQGKKNVAVDFSQVGETELNKLPKVGPKMFAALKAAGIKTFKDLANAKDEVLEQIRIEGGRPFANFDMSYFTKVANDIVNGATTIASPPKPASAKATGKKAGRKPKEINPNDLHILPGVGAQLVKALHDAGINTFEDLAGADKAVLADARAKTKGKYKNINLAYLQRQARHAAKGQYEKISSDVKIDKPTQQTKVDPGVRHLQRLQNAQKQDLEVLPGIGNSVKQAMNASGIKTFSQLANAKVERLREIAQNAGKRFARFDVDFWKDVAAKAHAGDFESIPVKPPVAEKPKRPARKDGKRAPRQARPPRTPRDSKDLGALPSIGATIIKALNDANISTFAQLAKASDTKLEEVRAASGPKYKTFPVAYWKQVAELAKEGTYAYPPVPKKAPKEKKERKARTPKAIPNTKLRALAGVGASLEAALRDNNINTFQDIVDAEHWQLSKAASEAGKRNRNLNIEALRKAARDATNGKFPEPTKRSSKKQELPEGAEMLKALPGIGASVQTKLFERGITTYKKLANANIGVLEAVRDEVGKRVAKADVREWRRLAKLAEQGEWSKIDPSKYEEAPAKEKPKKSTRPKRLKGGDDLTKIKGIGPQAVRFFATRGVKTYLDIVQLSDDALQGLIEEGASRIDPADFEKVRDAAAKLAGAASTTSKPKSSGKSTVKSKTKAKTKSTKTTKSRAKAKKK